MTRKLRAERGEEGAGRDLGCRTQEWLRLGEGREAGSGGTGWASGTRGAGPSGFRTPGGSGVGKAERPGAEGLAGRAGPGAQARRAFGHRVAQAWGRQRGRERRDWLGERDQGRRPVGLSDTGWLRRGEGREAGSGGTGWAGGTRGAGPSGFQAQAYADALARAQRRSPGSEVLLYNLYSDGLSYGRKNGTHVWSCALLLLSQHPRTRNKRAATVPLIVASYSRPSGKDLVMSILAKEMDLLATQGVPVTKNGLSQTARLFPFSAVADVPALSQLLHMRPVTSYYGCPHCLTKGAWCRDCRAVVFREATAERRTPAAVAADRQSASQTNTHSRGVRPPDGLNCAYQLLDMQNTSVDPLHAVMEGSDERLIKLLFLADKVLPGVDVTAYLTDFNAAITESIWPPGLRPRNLDKALSLLCGNEKHSISTVILPIFLHARLAVPNPDAFLTVYAYALGVKLCLWTRAQPQTLKDARFLLRIYYGTAHRIFGPFLYTSKVCVHLADQVERIGSAGCHGTWLNESMQGAMVHAVSSNQRRPLDMIRKAMRTLAQLGREKALEATWDSLSLEEREFWSLTLGIGSTTSNFGCAAIPKSADSSPIQLHSLVAAGVLPAHLPAILVQSASHLRQSTRVLVQPDPREPPMILDSRTFSRGQRSSQSYIVWRDASGSWCWGAFLYAVTHQPSPASPQGHCFLLAQQYAVVDPNLVTNLPLPQLLAQRTLSPLIAQLVESPSQVLGTYPLWAQLRYPLTHTISLIDACNVLFRGVFVSCTDHEDQPRAYLCALLHRDGHA